MRISATDCRAAAGLVPAGNSNTSERSNGFLTRSGSGAVGSNAAGPGVAITAVAEIGLDAEIELAAATGASGAFVVDTGATS